jgi:hypothetical protein
MNKLRIKTKMLTMNEYVDMHYWLKLHKIHHTLLTDNIYFTINDNDKKDSYEYEFEHNEDALYFKLMWG